MAIYQKLNWSQCQKDFEFDGTWRDIYILNTNSDDWNQLLESFLASKYQTIFWIDNKKNKRIQTIQEALRIRNHANTYMLINASGI